MTRESFTLKPQPGMQERFGECSADIAICGGSAGSGKTFSLLLEALYHINNPNFDYVIFRRESKQVTTPGGIRDEALNMYIPLGAEYRASPQPQFIFPSGAKVTFAHLNQEQEVVAWHGSQIALIGFDELCMFTEYQFFYMLSRNRSTSGIRPYVRATCLSGDTVVVGSGEKLIRIDECDQSTGLVSSFVETGEKFVERPSDITSRDIDEGLRVITCGNELICSKDHRFFRWSESGIEEAVASDLRVGDYLATSRSFDHGTRSIDIDDAYLMGYTIGDGGLTGRSHIPRLMWTESDEDHARFVASIAERVFDTTIGVHKISRANAFSFYTTRKSERVIDFVSKYKIAICKQFDRAIPVDYTDLDESGSAAILSGLFDSEGCVSGNRVEFCVTSRVLAHQVSVLLRRFGIFAKMVCCDAVFPRHRHYKIQINGRHAKSFAEKIGFRINRKNEKAKLIANANYRLSCSDADLVPVFRDSISHLKKYFGDSWWNKTKTIRRESADRIIDLAKSDGVDTGLLGYWCNHSWEKIIKIDSHSSFRAHDVTMPTAHTFFAGSILSHNCNPDSDSWVAQFISWWIDQETGYPIPELSGVLRYMIRVDGQIVWGSSRQDLVERYGIDPDDAKSVTFIPGRITENPALLRADPGYLANLKALSYVERSRLLDGNWKVRACAGMYFPRYDAVLIDWKPTEVVQWIRSWDLAASEVTDGKRVDYTVGMLVGRRPNGHIVIGDVIRVQRRAADVRELVRRTAENDGRDVWIALPQDPGQSGKDQVQSYKELLRGYSVLTRSITKNKILMAEPAAAQWQVGHVEIVRNKWNEDLLCEFEQFPEALHDDQVDAFAAACNRLPGAHAPDYSKSGLSDRFRSIRQTIDRRKSR